MAKPLETLDIPIQGMDCADCTLHVQRAIAALPGVEAVDVFLGSEKAIVRLDPAQVDLPAIRTAVEHAGYSVGETASQPPAAGAESNISRPLLTLLGIVFGAVLFIVVVGEWLGLFEAITARIPWPLSLAIVLALGYPVFRKVFLAALRGQVISHTLMTVGAAAAMLAGEWATALVVVFFMRVGDYVERFTTERARRLLKDLTSLAPQTARVERDGQELEVPIAEVAPGDIVVVRPGEKIPVDGEVVAGHAVVDQATITGESMPVEAGPGAQVFAATLAGQGSLKVRTEQVGQDTTFGRLVKLVEEAEGNKAEVQRIADRFSAYYLPVVAVLAALTFLIRRDPMATVAVLVVACSCSFALATPIAMLASIGAAAKHGLLIKGGKYLEILDKADVLLIDKTGTLTLGKPQITSILSFGEANLLAGPSPARSRSDELTLLQLAASAERYSEHPLASAVRLAAVQRGLELYEPQGFQSYPGVGVHAGVNGYRVSVGNRRIVEGLAVQPNTLIQADTLEAQGKTLMYVLVDDQLAGILAAEDTLREEVPHAIQSLQEMGFRRVELLTGDNARTAAALAGQIGVEYRAGLLPEDKIAIVKEYQSQGHKVVMVGDGVNDAPALAQADVGIAMGAAGSDVAVEAAHIALLRDDWSLVPEVVRIARRTLRVVKGNIYFTAFYNLAGLTLAAFGYLPPILAAAVQSLPDLGILANSSRLLKHR